ncbi:MAG: hypothetical protein R3C59_19345 [Planctomycetaceae bacterium]
MSITLTTIPEQTADWPKWLDRQLMEFRLSDLVDELNLINPLDNRSPLSLDKVITDSQRDQVLQSGTAALSLEQLQILLGHPETLLDLQELVLEFGGDYWNQFPPSSDIQNLSAAVFEKLNQSADSGQSPDVVRPGQVVSSSPRGRLTWILTTIAAVLLAVTVYQMQPMVPTGLSNPALLTANAESAQEWFDAVADAGQQWSTQDLSDTPKLLAAIQETSDACGRLIANPHPVLNGEERDWFVQKCQNWKTKLDDTHAALLAGNLNYDDARQQANGIMTRLVDVLKAGPNA